MTVFWAVILHRINKKETVEIFWHFSWIFWCHREIFDKYNMKADEKIEATIDWNSDEKENKES